MSVGNHLELVAILYIIFAALVVITIVVKIARNRRISIMNMCSAMYAILLCIVPALILLGYANGLRVASGILFEERTIWTFYLQFAFTAMGYFFLHVGYMVKQKKCKPYNFFTNSNGLLISMIFSAISMISLNLWASGYGGIDSLILNANQIRAGWVTSTNSFAFFKHFVPLSLLTSWMLFNMLIRKEVKGFFGKFGVMILLLCNVALSNIYIQANDGRMLLAVYVFLYFVLYLKYKFETKQANIAPMLLKFGIVFIVVISILFNADAILGEMRNGTYESGNDSDIITTVSREFSFILSGTQNALIKDLSGEGKLMIMNDVVNGVFAWLPTSLKPIMMEDVWDYNTRSINTGEYGQLPTSIIGQSIYDLGLLGIILLPFIYGVIIKKVEMVLEGRKENIFYNTVYVVLGYYLCKGIPYFSFYNIMINTFFIFIAILIYNTVHKKNTVRL